MGGRQLGGRIDSTSLNRIQLNSLLEVSNSHFGIFVNLDYLTDALAIVTSALSAVMIKPINTVKQALGANGSFAEVVSKPLQTALTPFTTVTS